MNIDEFNANRDKLEPIASAAQTDEEVWGLSIAASLKRIADVLDPSTVQNREVRNNY